MLPLQLKNKKLCLVLKLEPQKFRVQCNKTIPAIKKQKILFRFKTRTIKIQGMLQQKANTCIAKLPGNKDFAVSNHALAE